MPDHTVLAEKNTAEASPEAILAAAEIRSAMDGETALFNVLSGVGKSRSVLTAAKETEIPFTVFTNLRDNYDQIMQWGKQEGVDVEKLPTRELCPILKDDNPAYPNDSAAQEARATRDAGWSPSVIHRKFDLPCQDGEMNCPYQAKSREIDTDGPTLLVGHFTQAYNPSYVKDRVVVIDEGCYDAFKRKIKNPIEKAEEYISTLGQFPFDEVRRPEMGEQQKQIEAIRILEDEGLEPSDHGNSVGEFHVKAPLTAYSIYGANRIQNGLHIAEHDEKTAVFADLYRSSLWLLDPPNFSDAEAVLALDATPCISNWKRILGDDVKQYRLFNDQQRNHYLRQRGYEFFQLNSHVWPVSGANVSIDKCEAYLREIRCEHDQPPDLITSKSLRNTLEERGVDHLWRKDLHFNALRGKNDLADSSLLLVLGSPSRSDTYYQYQAALHGEFAEPATDGIGERLSGLDLDYQSGVANDILVSTRRGEVLQAAMRVGRHQDNEATVYIATGMVPDWLSTTSVGQGRVDGTFDACIENRNDPEKEAIEILQNEEDLSGREIARRADVPKSTMLDALNRLREEEAVEKAGAGRGTTWRGLGISELNVAGRVDLSRVKRNRKMSGTPLKKHNKGISANRSLLNRSGECTDPFGYPPWMKEVRHQAKMRRQAERLSRSSHRRDHPVQER